MIESYLTCDYPEEGRYIEVIPLTFQRARITITDGLSVYDSW